MITTVSARMAQERVARRGSPSEQEMMVLLLALACSREPDLVALYERDPAAAVARIEALDDPEAQQAALLRLVEARPGETAAICRQLATPALQGRCQRFNSRPHLWTIPTDEPRRTWQERPGGGPDGTFQPTPEDPTLWAGVTPEDTACADDAPALRRACLSELALARAREGDADGAGAACLGIHEDRSRQDCFFAAAEQAVLTTATYRAAMPLCLGAGTFRFECHSHVTLLLVQRAPPAGPYLPGLAMQRAESVAAWWADRGEEAAGRVNRERFWALYVSMVWTPGTLAQGFLELPEVAHPAVRDRIAAAVAAAPEPFAAARAVAQGTALRAPAVRLRNDVSWADDLEGEEVIPAGWLALGDGRAGRRPRDPDPETDLDLALLTMVAHLDRPRIDLLVAAATDEREVVRWSAVRLLAWLDQEDELLARLAESDPSPLVRQRARTAVPPELGSPDAALGPPLPDAEAQDDAVLPAAAATGPPLSDEEATRPTPAGR